MLQVPSLRGKDLLDSVYDELRILSPEDYYYDDEVGAIPVCRSLARAWMQLKPLVGQGEVYQFRTSATLTVQSGTPNYVVLPLGFSGFLDASIDEVPVLFHSSDGVVAHYRRTGFSSVRHVPVTRSGDNLLIHSDQVSAGDEMELAYSRIPPQIAGVALMNYASDVTFDVAATVGSAGTKSIGYATDELAGGVFVSVGQSWYGEIQTSTTTTIKADRTAGGSVTVPASLVKSAWVATPAIDGPSVNAVIAQACLFLKGEDVTGHWKETVSMIRSGRAGVNRVAGRIRSGPFGR